MKAKTLAEACILWRMGELDSDSLPEVGQMALAEDIDSADIRTLSSLQRDESREAVKYFERICEEVWQRAPFSTQRPFKLFVQLVSRRILTKEIGAYDGARKIWEASLRAGKDDAKIADPFVYAASEMEERPTDRQFFVRAIESEARRQLLIELEK